MHLINGAAKSGKNRLLQKLAVNSISSKIVGASLVKNVSADNEAVHILYPYAANDRIVERSTFSLSKMTFRDFDDFIGAIENSQIPAIAARNFLLSGAFVSIEGDVITTSDLTCESSDGTFIKTVDDKGCALIAQVKIDQDRVEFVQGWIAAEALLNGIYLKESFVTFIFEGVASLPLSFCYNKGGSVVSQLSDQEKLSLADIFDSYCNETKDTGLSKIPLEATLLMAPNDLKKIRGLTKSKIDKIKIIIEKYANFVSRIADANRIVDGVQVKKPFVSNVLSASTTDGRKLSVSITPASVPFSIIRTGAAVDSMLPLAFLAGGSAAAGGISSKALLVLSTTTLNETFVTFPEESFLGDAEKWEPLLTGKVFFPQGKIEPPIYFESRFTNRSIKHLLIDQNSDLLIWRGSVRTGVWFAQVADSHHVVCISEQQLKTLGLLTMSDGCEVLDLPAIRAAIPAI